jgi:hypothetical protein
LPDEAVRTHVNALAASVGTGKRIFPNGARLDLTLLDERRLGNGNVFLRYAVRS